MTTSQKCTFYLPRPERMLDQDEEYILLKENGREEKVLFHDYSRIYEVPGLYETLFYDQLKCQSPMVVVDMLQENMSRENEAFSDLRILDLGAGNGMVGEELADRNAAVIVGTDIIPEAKKATLRDRPEVYDEYAVLDFTDLPDRAEAHLRDYHFNGLVTVAALGFGDIPPEAFIGAFNIVDEGAWVAFNIRDKFLSGEDESGFREVLKDLTENHFELKDSKQYVHRYNLHGEPLMYKAFVGIKLQNVDN